MPRGYWPARSPYGLVQLTWLYATDMATVHGLIIKRITDLIELRNFYEKKQYGTRRSIETTKYYKDLITELNTELKPLRSLKNRFYKRLRTAQRKIHNANRSA